MSSQLRIDVDRAISALFVSVGANLRLDDNGMVALGFDEGVEITLEVPQAGPVIYAHAPIVRLPPDAGLTILERALELNLFRTGVTSGWIAFDRESRTLTLCATLPAHGIGRDALNTFLTEMFETVRALGHDIGRTAQKAREAQREQPQDALVIRA